MVTTKCMWAGNLLHNNNVDHSNLWVILHHLCVGRAKKPKSTLKAPPPMDRTTPSPTFRKPVKHAPPKSTSSVGKSSVGGAGGGRMSSHTKLTAPVRVSLSLKERVIHFLAIKPQKRDEVLLKISKGDYRVSAVDLCRIVVVFKFLNNFPVIVAIVLT